MSHSDKVEKTHYDQAQDLLEKYADPDAGVIPDKVIAEIEQLKSALEAEKENATTEVATIHQTLVKLSNDGKLKGRFVVGSENEFDCYNLEADEDTHLTLVLFPADRQYEWKFEEDLQFGVDTLPAFDVLHKDLSAIKKANLLPRLFNATQADSRNPDAIEKLDALLVANGDRKQKALIAEWRETLEYVLTELKDDKSGKSVFIDQLFPYTKNGKTKSYKITKADRTGLVVMIDEELELDRKFHIDSYAYDMIAAFMPILAKHKGKSPTAKPASRASKQKNIEKSVAPSLVHDNHVESTISSPEQSSSE